MFLNAGMFPRRMFKDFMPDLSGIGGLPIYVIVALLFAFTGSMTVFWQLFIGLALVYSIFFAIRLLHFRERPDKQPHHGLLQTLDASSFPSIHAGRVTVLGIILMNFYTNGLISTLMILLVVAVSTTRVVLKRHYWLDVLCGLFFGVAIALLTIKFI